MSNPFQNIGKNFVYLTIGLTASVVIVKTLVRDAKVSKFDPQSLSEEKKDDYYSNLALVKPGFPVKKEDDASEHKRKSEFEGSGLSYLSRKGGDRLGFFDRREKD